MAGELEDVGALNDRILTGFRLRRELDLEIGRLVAKYVAPVKARRAAAMQNLTADTDVGQKNLLLFYALWARQEEAGEEEDASKGEIVLDDLRTTFGALTSGGMLDFVTLDPEGFSPRSRLSSARQDLAEEAAESIAP